MIKFYLNKHGQTVSVREGRYCDGTNFYRLNLSYMGNEDFLREEVVPSADIIKKHLEKWRFVPEAAGIQNNSLQGKPYFSAS